MAQWKKRVARLGLDFKVKRYDILSILRETEKRYATREMPKWYKGNREDYLYDHARTEIINKACDMTTKYGSGSSGTGCAAKIVKDGWKITYW